MQMHSMRCLAANSNSNGSSRVVQPVLVQQRPSGIRALEHSAAASRPAVLPEQLEASTSSRDHSAYSNSRRRQHDRTGACCTSEPTSGSGSGSSRSSWGYVQPEVIATAADPADVLNRQFPELPLQRPADPVVRNTGKYLQDDDAADDLYLTEAGWQVMQIITEQPSNWQELAEIVQQHAHQFTAHHCAAALYTLAELWQQQSVDQQPQLRAGARLQYLDVLKFAGVLFNGLQQQLADARPRDVADALYAAVKLGFKVGKPRQPLAEGTSSGDSSSSAAASDVASQGDNDMIGDQQHSTATVRPRVLSAVFVSELLQHSQQQLLAGKFRSRQLARVLWGCAQLRLKLSAEWWAIALDVASERMQQLVQQHQQQQPGHRQDLQHNSEATMLFCPQSLATVGWVVAKLHAPASRAWWTTYMAATEMLMRSMEPQHLSNCVWALASAHQQPDSSWLDRFYACSEQYLVTDGSASAAEQDDSSWCCFNSQGFSNIVWALAVLQQRPPSQWQQQFEAAAAAQLPEFIMQHLSMTLWAFGRFRSLSSGSSSSSGWLCLGVEQQHQIQQQNPSPAWIDQALAQLPRLESEATAQGVACILWSLVKLDVVVCEQQFQHLERLVAQVLYDAQPQGMAVMTWALGVLRGPQTSRALIKRIRRRCYNSHAQLKAQLTSQGVVMLLKGLSRFDAYQPPWLKQQLLILVDKNLPLGLRDSSGNQLHSGSSSSSHSSRGFSSHELPAVLLSLAQLQVELPTELLRKVEQLLLQDAGRDTVQQRQRQLDTLSTSQLCVLVFALGQVKHQPEARFWQTLLTCVASRVESMQGQDIAYALYGIASMGEIPPPPVLQQQQQNEERWQRLMARTEQVLVDMDSTCLAMLMWSLPRLKLRPSEQFLQQCLTTTSAQLPQMTLLSITSVLAALQALGYLPPVSWMVETCQAARVKVNTDVTPKKWQRRACVRRLEETVKWFNEVTMQQQGANIDRDSRELEDRSMQRRAVGAVLKGAAGILGAGNTSSEALIAAAVGVAAAVAQQWRW